LECLPPAKKNIPVRIAEKRTIPSYPEEFLPYAVRGRVKSTYYFDYTINRAEEIQINNKTVYIIHIEDKSGFKLLRVCDDEMEVIKELNKK
jgi:hypothetical protein